MKYTNEQLLKIEESARKNKKKLTHITDKSKLSTEDKVKLGLCKHFIQFALNKNLKLKQVAELLDIPMPRLSEIINYKINKFSVDFLLEHLSTLARHDAQIKAFLEFFGQAAEMPALPVTRTRKLTKDIKEASLLGI